MSEEEDLLKPARTGKKFDQLFERMAEFVPDEADFSIFQISPDGEIQILKPIERPGFSATELKKHLNGDEEASEQFFEFTNHLPRPVLVELDPGGEVQKISMPGG